jgi:hypothetical protein
MARPGSVLSPLLDLLSERERGLIESLERWRGTPNDKQFAFLRNVFTQIIRLASAS